MKEIFHKYSPFVQVLLFVGIGVVSFVLISAIINVIIGGLYPEMPSQTALLAHHYPIQFILLNYLPFQVGFLLIPGGIYLRLTKNLPPLQKKSFRWMTWGWAALLFISVFLLLPLLTKINTDVTSFLGVTDKLRLLKNKSDQQMATVVGHVGSTAFYFTLITVGLITGIAEELAFRRFLFHHIFKNTKKLGLSILASALIFALLHFNYIQLLPLFIFGIVLALIYSMTRSLLPGMIFHTLNNCITIYWLASNNYPDWLTHVNIAITIPVLLVFVLLLYFFVRKKESIQVLAHEL